MTSRNASKLSYHLQEIMQEGGGWKTPLLGGVLIGSITGKNVVGHEEALFQEFPVSNGGIST